MAELGQGDADNEEHVLDTAVAVAVDGSSAAQGDARRTRLLALRVDRWGAVNGVAVRCDPLGNVGSVSRVLKFGV